jgi:hypothetical protein
MIMLLITNLKVTDEEVAQIKRLARSSSVLGLSDAVLRGLDEYTLSRIIAGYLYFKSNGRPDKDFAMYLGTKEIWSTLTIGLNVMGAVIPALLFDKEFRTLVMKTGINKGSEIGSKAVSSKVASTDFDKRSKKK